jgi:hypothetical protein
MTRFFRSLRVPALALALLAAPAVPVHAQATAPEAPAEGGESTGEPLYGYVGTAIIGALAIFILCKSARR